MKRLSFLTISVMLLLFLTSCSKNQSRKLVPEDALFVMRLDVAKIQDKAGMNDGKSTLKEWFKEQIENSSMDKELSKKMLAIVDDPTASGIDFTEPVYLYFSGDMRTKVDAGMVGAIASKGDLTDLMEALTKEMGNEVEVEEGDGGVKYIYANGTALVYNGDWFFMGASNDIEETITMLNERADGKGSLIDNKAFAQMEEKEGLMQMLFLGSGMEGMKTTREMELAFKELEKILPEGVELKDIASLTDLMLNDGELLITGEAVPLSDEVKEWINKYDEIANDITPDLAQYASNEMLNIFFSADASAFFEILQPMIKEQMGDEELKVIKDLVKELDGTLALDLYGFSEDGTPQVSAYLGTKSNKALSFVAENLGDELEAAGTDEYLIPIREYDWFEEVDTIKGYSAVGYKNGMTYYVSNPEYAFSVPGEKFPVKELKGKAIYMRFNFGFLENLAKMTGDEEGEFLEKVAETYDFAECYYESAGKSVFRITTKSKDTNPVQAIFKLIEEYL